MKNEKLKKNKNKNKKRKKERKNEKKEGRNCHVSDANSVYIYIYISRPTKGSPILLLLQLEFLLTKYSHSLKSPPRFRMMGIRSQTT